MNILKKIVFFTTLGVSLNGYAQFVGIGTTSPKQPLHIHPLNIPTTDTTKDVVFSSDGCLGIGIINPNALFHIKTSGSIGSPVLGFQLQDGTESDNYVLTSDQDGYASWKPLVYKGAAVAYNNPNGASLKLSDYSNSYISTGTSIKLGPGRWLLNLTFLIPPANLASGAPGYNLGFSFADDPSVPVPSLDFESINFIKGMGYNGVYGIAQGELLINNSTSSPKTYHLLTGMTNSTENITINRVGGYYGEDVVFAFLIYNE